jgi:hypothetical protein
MMARIALEVGKSRYARQAGAERPQAELYLRRKGLWRAQGHRRGLTLTCLEGTVWITLAGDPQDHILSGGQALSVGRQGRVLVEALRDARLRLA